MSYQSDIYDAIQADPTLSGLVGTRVFPYVADGSTTAPYIVYSTVAVNGETTHDGEREIEFPMIQFNAWATTDTGATAIGDALNTLFDGNTITGASGATFRFANRFGQYEQDTKLFGETIEFDASTNK